MLSREPVLRWLAPGGSHHYLYHAQRDVIVTVPVHSKKILAPKTLQAILFQSGITVDEFRALL